LSAYRQRTSDLTDMARMAAPIVAINVGQQAMGVVDMLMVGPLGGAAIAAVALGNFFVFNVSIFGVGLLFALDPVVAQAIGAGDHEHAARAIQRGFVLAVFVAIVVSALLLPVESVLRWFGQPPEVVPITGNYVRMRALGVLPFFVYNSTRQSLQALGTVWPVVLAIVVANVINVGANWVLIHGHWGVPALGVSGSGLATAIATIALAFTLWLFAQKTMRPYVRPRRPEAFAWRPMLLTIRLGAPIGAQFFFESFAFGLTALLMGWMGTASLAGHEIALNMAALTFMVPLGMSGAAAAVVGRAIGRGDMSSARRDAIASVGCGVGFMCLTALVFVTAPRWLAERYTDDSATLAIAATLLPLAGAFQVFDGLQAVTGGVLRGTGDTQIPALLHMFAFWAIGVPLGAYLGFQTPLRERGLWIGLVAGLAVASVLLSWRVLTRLRGPIARVAVETRPAL